MFGTVKVGAYFFTCTATFTHCNREIDYLLLQKITLNNRKQHIHLVLGCWKQTFLCPVQYATRMQCKPSHEQWSNKEVQYTKQRWAPPIEFRYSENLNVRVYPSSAFGLDVLPSWRTTDILYSVHCTHLVFCSSWTDVGHQGSPFNTTFKYINEMRNA